MRIIHVIDDLNEQAGGPAQACIEMAASVAAKGHYVSIYAFGRRRPAWFPQSGSLPRAIRHLGVDVYLFPGRSSSISTLSSGLHGALAGAIPSADVVHAHVLYGLHLWVAWRLCQAHRVPLILRPCGILNAYASSSRQVRERLIERLFQRRLLHQAALMHYTTEQEAADAGPYVGSSGHVVIPLGVTLTSCRALPSRAEFDEQYPKARARKVVLYFGRLHRKKRIDLVIRAVGDVVREGHDLHLIIAGPDGGVEAQCRRMVQDERLENRTTFTGLLVGHAKRLVFGGADIFVLPSMTENFGIAVAEAAASGIPLLISNQVNIAPVFAREDAAVIVSPDLTAVTNGLRHLVFQPALATAMAARARMIVEQHFRWDSVANDLVSMYWSIAMAYGRNPVPTLVRPVTPVVARDNAQPLPYQPADGGGA